jgi:hypothetical protein
MSQNVINNSALEAFQIPRTVYNAIRKASAATGANFAYMVEKAAVESNFNAGAKAKTSSATGLYQFIESTWLSMVKQHGDKYGLAKYADKIDTNGRVSDPKVRKEILELRKDPEIASYMACEFANGNYQRLKDNVGGDIGSTELYMAHFLGAGGASGFLNAMKKSPNMVGADLFPKEARANRNVFYDSKTGAPRTLKQIYAMFDAKFQSNGTPNIAVAKANNSPNDETVLRTAGYSARPPYQAKQVVYETPYPFSRLAALMGQSDSNSMMRIATNNRAPQALENNWQILPPSMYNRLSLSPAQMMMLSSFNA